jgi:hypothetical protein
MGTEILLLKTITNQMELKKEYKFLDDKLLAVRISGDNQTKKYADLLQSDETRFSVMFLSLCH